jgi:hypothetical protein
MELKLQSLATSVLILPQNYDTMMNLSKWYSTTYIGRRAHSSAYFLMAI